MDESGATPAEEFREQCEEWFTGEYRAVPTPFLYALFGVIHVRLQAGTFDSLIESPDFATLEAQLSSFPADLAEQARSLSESLDALALSTGAMIGGSEMLGVLDRVSRTVRGLRGEASVSSSAGRSVTTSARPLGPPQAVARRQVTSGQFDVVSSSTPTSAPSGGATYRPGGGISVSARSLRHESGESSATSTEVMDFGGTPRPSVRKEGGVHSEVMDFGGSSQPSVRKEGGIHSESMDFGAGSPKVSSSVASPEQPEPEGRSESMDFAVDPPKPAPGPPRLAEPPFMSFGKIPPHARPDAASARHTSGDASPFDGPERDPADARASAPPPHLGGAGSASAVPLPPPIRRPGSGAQPAVPPPSRGPASGAQPAVPPPIRRPGSGAQPAVPPPSRGPASGAARSMPSPSARPTTEEPREAAAGAASASGRPSLPSPPGRGSVPAAASSVAGPAQRGHTTRAAAVPGGDEPEDDPRSSTAPTSRRLDLPGASQPTAAMPAFRPEEGIPMPTGGPRLTPRLVPAVPSTSGAFATVGAAPQPGGRRPTISGAFMALDAAEEPVGAEDAPPPSGWPRNLDAWIGQPPADLLWNHESSEDSTESTLSRLVGLVHSAPVVGVEIEGTDRKWTLWAAEGSVVAFHAAPGEGLPDLVDLLLRNRSIDEAQARGLKASASEGGASQRAVIAESRAVSHRVLEKAHRALLRTLLAAMLGSSLKHIRAVGFAEFSPPDDAVGVSVLGVLHRALLKASQELSSAELRRRLERRRQYYPVFRAPDGFSVKRLGLDERELELVTGLLGGEHSLDRVLAMSTVNAPATLAILHTLDSLGLIGWVSRRAQDLWVETTREKLRDRQNAWQNADPFTILGTHWSAYDEAVLRAWSDMRKRLDIERALGSQDEDLRSLAREVDQQLLLARDSVADRDARERARRKLVDRSRRSGAVQLSLDQANLALFQEDADRVRDACQRALELSPGNVDALEILKKV